MCRGWLFCLLLATQVFWLIFGLVPLLRWWLA